MNGTRERAARISFPYLALHREEFAWPSSVTTDAGELLPHRFTRDPEGPVFSLLHLSSSRMNGTPGRYPARCPVVFGLSSASVFSEAAIA